LHAAGAAYETVCLQGDHMLVNNSDDEDEEEDEFHYEMELGDQK